MNTLQALGYLPKPAHLENYHGRSVVRMSINDVES